MMFMMMMMMMMMMDDDGDGDDYVYDDDNDDDCDDDDDDKDDNDDDKDDLSRTCRLAATYSTLCRWTTALHQYYDICGDTVFSGLFGIHGGPYLKVSQADNLWVITLDIAISNQSQSVSIMAAKLASRSSLLTLSHPHFYHNIVKS